MEIKKLKVTLKGPLWSIENFEIEGIDVIDRWEEGEDEGSVTVTTFEISEDRILDIFIKIGAPNGAVYNVLVEGTTNGTKNDISFSRENLEVVKHGKLNILISEEI